MMGLFWTDISKELPPEERLERLKALGEPSRRLGRLPERSTGRPSLGPPLRRAATVRPGDGWRPGMENPGAFGGFARILVFEGMELAISS